MVKKKTSKKQRNFTIDDIPIHIPKTPRKTKQIDPTARLKEVEFVAQAMMEALLLGDKKTFMEIFRAHIMAKNISEIERKSKIKRSTIYSAIAKDANPTIGTIITLLKNSA